MTKVWTLLLMALVAGCALSPTPTLYTLAPINGQIVTAPAMSIELRRIGLAGYLDRPELVRGTRDYHLVLDDKSHWAEPLGTMLDRVLSEDLVLRLPQATVFRESGAISTKPDLIVEIDIQRLDSDRDEALVLLAQIALRPERGTARASTLRLQQAVGGTNATSQAAAMSAALGALADRIAAQIVALRTP
jgi:uncharacterized lipoprotein YmbA